MALDKLNVVDSIGIDKTGGQVTLAIIDEQNWEEEEQHLLLLQEKINFYLSFLESGEVYSSYPKAEGREFEIKVFAQYEPTPLGYEFLEHVSGVIEGAGFSFVHQLVTT